MEDQKVPQFRQYDTVDEFEENSNDARPSVTEESVHPSRHLHFGTHIAVSIDDASVTMAAVSHLGHYRKIKDLKKQHFGNEITKPGERASFTTKVVNDFLDKHQGPISVVSLTISGRETALRSFLIPALKRKDLNAAIEIEAKKQLPFPIDECTYDFRPISKITSDKRELYNISLLAATRRMINDKLNSFGEKRKYVEHIYHAPDTVGRLLPYIDQFEEFGSYMTLNIGQHESEIAFYRGSALEFYSIISAGASLLGNDPDASSSSFLAESLASEIQTAIDFYTGSFSRRVTNTIFVYGDLTNNEDVINGMKNSSGYKFERFPINKIKFLTSADLETYNQEITLCLPAFAAASSPAGMADVLPKESKQKHKSSRVTNYAKASLVIVALLLIASWGLLTQSVSIKQSELVSLNSQVADFVNSDAYQTYNLYRKQIAIDRAYLQAAEGDSTFLSLNLKELTLLIPKQIRLLNMQFRPSDPEQNLYLQGLAFSRTVPPEIIVVEFIENMSHSPFYENVEVTKHAKRELNGGFEIDFTIKCRGII